MALWENSLCGKSRQRLLFATVVVVVVVVIQPQGVPNTAGKDAVLQCRLLAVPFWIVERAREIAVRKSRNLKRTCGGGPAGKEKKGTPLLAVTDAFR